MPSLAANTNQSMRKLALLTIMLLIVGCSNAINAKITPEQNSQSAAEFLNTYGWSIRAKLSENKITLPANLIHEPGTFPNTLYWAYNHVLSQAIGLDFSAYLGETIDVTIYALVEELPPFLKPYSEGRAIILRRDGLIIGAWIDAGTSLDAASTLDRRSFREIIDSRYAEDFSLQFHRLVDYWGKWLTKDQIADPNNEIDLALAALSPDQVIRTFFAAINAQDYQTAYACLTRDELSSVLFVNLLSSGKAGKLFHESYAEAAKHGDMFIRNIISAEIIQMRKLNTTHPEEIEYEVRFDVRYKEEDIFYHDGIEMRFFILKEEIEGLGYRIDGIGTGP
jgi:hypothetical protein